VAASLRDASDHGTARLAAALAEYRGDFLDGAVAGDWHLEVRGPPPHIHRREDETFYVLEGTCTFRLGDERITAGPGDFINVPRGMVHCFHNDGTEATRLILTFTPGGMEDFFRDTLERAYDIHAPVPDNVGEVAARYVAAAPRHGLEFVVE
jgi:mannose-6-phosphate isomerase-like protein (cupin superfamily)